MENSLYQITDDARPSFFVPEFFTLYLIWIFLFAVHSPIVLSRTLFTI